MRIVLFILLSSTLFMCKSKEILSSDQMVNYIVVLKGESEPKVLKKEVKYGMIDSQKADETLNIWSINFKAIEKDAKKVKAALLNHSEVVSVFSKEQYEKIKLKKGKKVPNGGIGGRQDSKQ